MPASFLRSVAGPNWDLMLNRNWYPLGNFPRQAQAVDGSRIYCFAMKLPGGFQYTSVSGAIKTVEQLDYGIPYDPWQRANEIAAQKERAATKCSRVQKAAVTTYVGQCVPPVPNGSQLPEDRRDALSYIHGSVLI
ncbi:MAG: hypothetical protein ABI651_15770 [Verrucomicrobiota bacterium]